MHGQQNIKKGIENVGAFYRSVHLSSLLLTYTSDDTKTHQNKFANLLLQKCLFLCIILLTVLR